MKKLPSLILVEPTARQKQRRLAEVIQRRSIAYSQDAVIRRLKEIRRRAVDNMADLAARFRQSVTDYSDAHIVLANNTTEAVDYITKVTQDTKTVAIGKSSTIGELQPGLEKNGHSLIDTYSPQFSRGGEGQKGLDYPWQLPATPGQFAWDTFDYGRETERQAHGA